AFGQLGYRCIYLSPHLGREFDTAPLSDRRPRLAELATNVFELHVRLPREPVYHHRLLHPKEDVQLAGVIRNLLPDKPRGAMQIVSLPVWMGVARALRQAANWPIVYDCHDFLSGFANIAPEILHAEPDALRDADLVLFSAPELRQAHPAVRSSVLL